MFTSDMNVLFGLVFVSGVFGQLPTPCTTPSEMQFGAFQVDHLKNTVTRVLVEYDAPNERIAFTEMDAFPTKRQLHSMIFLHREHVLFDINLATKTCKKIPLKRPFRQFAVDKNASFVTDLTVGGPEEDILAQAWTSQTEHELWVGVFSVQNCFPIRIHLFHDGMSTDSSSTDFYDVVAGVVDPGAFVPPPECEQYVDM